KGNETHDALAYRIGGKPLPGHLPHLEKYASVFDGRGAKAEGRGAIDRGANVVDYFAKNAWLRGAVDVAVVNGEIGYICDWKSGRSRYEKRFELDVHAVLLRARYPHIRTIRAQYCYTEEDKLSELYDCSDVRQTWMQIAGIIKKIEAD